MNNLYKNILSLIILLNSVIISQVEISVPNLTEREGSIIEIPINVSSLTDQKVRSYYFELNYDKSILRAKSIIEDGTLSSTRGWDVNAGFTNKGIYVYGSGYRYLYGEGKLVIVEFEVIADQGYTELILDDVDFNNGDPDVETSNGSFRVYLEKEISFSTVGDGSGIIVIDDEQIETPKEINLVHGEKYTIEAIPNENSSFVAWSGLVNSTQNPRTFQVSEDGSIKAEFIHKTYSVSASVYPEGFGNVEGVGIYKFGQTAILTANPYSGNEFLNWTVDGNVVRENTTFEFKVENNINLVANFESTLVQITAIANPLEAGQIIGSGYYSPGQEVELIATSNANWTFKNWTELGFDISEDSVMTFTVGVSREFLANYSELPTDVYDEELIQDKFYLKLPYPNPFNPSTTFQFGLKNNSTVSLKIFDVSGKIISTLFDSEHLSKGNYSKIFIADNLSNGIYFYTFKAKSSDNELLQESGKLLLLK